MSNNCVIPFTKREFIILSLIAEIALSNPEIFDTITEHKYLKKNKEEVQALGEKVDAFLDV
jgi:hypothetical protein